MKYKNSDNKNMEDKTLDLKFKTLKKMEKDFFFSFEIMIKIGFNFVFNFSLLCKFVLFVIFCEVLLESVCSKFLVILCFFLRNFIANVRKRKKINFDSREEFIFFNIFSFGFIS